MTALTSSAGTYIEISQTALKVRAGASGLELPLDRGEQGNLTPQSRQKTIAALRTFLEKHASRRQRAVCAISARGVSLRLLAVPAASGEEFERLLSLQVEREFPLSPAQLAWGWQPVAEEPAPRNGSPRTQQVLVAAVKRDLLQDYADMLSAAGLNATFTLAAFARMGLVESPPADYTLVDVAAVQAEVLSVERGHAASLRTISLELDGAGDGKAGSAGVGAPKTTTTAAAVTVLTPARAEVSSLPAIIQGAVALPGKNSQRPVFVSGLDAATVAAQIAHAKALTVPATEGASAATLGLARMIEREGVWPLVLDLKAPVVKETAAPPRPWKWIAFAALLLVLALAVPYLEALVKAPRLTRRIAEIKAYRDKLPNVDRELAFLQYLKTNQPAYLDAVSLIAEASPNGTRIESLSLDRRGNLSVRASMRDGQQVTDLRTKLINSELFSSVVVEEQSPGSGKLVVRLSGQWKPFAERKPAPAATTGDTRPKREGAAQSNGAVSPVLSDRNTVTSGDTARN